jgi:ribonuclease-3 family protein
MTITAADAAHINTTTLAWVGDAAYELRVRKHLCLTGRAPSNADALHRAAVRYVRADAQALAIRELFDTLTPEEQDLAKRARNKRISTKPKNADPIAYKWATAFEALIGYYCLIDDDAKIDEIAERAIGIIDLRQV